MWWCKKYRDKYKNYEYNKKNHGRRNVQVNCTVICMFILVRTHTHTHTRTHAHTFMQDGSTSISAWIVKPCMLAEWSCKSTWYPSTCTHEQQRVQCLVVDQYFVCLFVSVCQPSYVLHAVFYVHTTRLCRGSIHGLALIVPELRSHAANKLLRKCPTKYCSISIIHHFTSPCRCEASIIIVLSLLIGTPSVIYTKHEPVTTHLTEVYQHHL